MTPASRRLVLQGVLFGAACGCLGVRAAYAAETPAPAPGGKYVCPPCGCAADGKEFDKPGSCPECGMPLVPKAGAPTPPKSRAEAGAGFVAASDRAPRDRRGRVALG